MGVAIWQAVLIGLLAYLGSMSVPWFFGYSGSWYTLSRPLVSGLLIGLILGDVTTGVMVGVAVQIVYIALITPGGQMPQDLNAAAYIGVSLGVLAVRGGATLGSAVAIATAVGTVGTIFHNFMMLTNSFWNHRAIAAIERGDYRGLTFNHIVGPQLVQFAYRFIPTALIVYYGASLATNIINYFPADSIAMRTLTVLGGMLPAVGVAILLMQVTHRATDIIYFLLGFTFVAMVNINMIGLAIVGAFFALTHYKFTARLTPSALTPAHAGQSSDLDEEL